MSLKQIGLVTLFRNNYGSALQCYATKTTFKKFGYDCELLFEKTCTNRSLYTRTIKNISEILNSLFYRNYLKSRLIMRKAMKIEQSYLTVNSQVYLDKFVKNFLKPNEYTWNELCEIGNDDDYVAFFVGSDQVWNASRKITPFYFLKFSPINKRHTYAVSLGVSDVPVWNLKNLKNGLKDFKCISVRENAGIRIVQQNSNADCRCFMDPTILLTEREWRTFCQEAEIPLKKYCFVHFLNTPNDVAINAINLFSKKTGNEIVCFAYKHDDYKRLNNFRFIDGSPQDYVALIDKAELVFTDSFHTTIFSINLKTDFYVFHRQYLHGFPQTSRLIDLLEKFDLLHRLVSEIDDINFEKIQNEYSAIIQNERNNALDYLKDELKKQYY